MTKRSRATQPRPNSFPNKVEDLEVTIRGTTRATLGPRRSAFPLTTLGGVVLVLLISAWNSAKISQLDGSLDEKIGRLEAQINQVSEKVNNVARAAPQPARRGPDPTRTYKIKTDGAPSKGSANAPIVLAEFSDFQ